MLYDTNSTTDLKELQVVAATGLAHRSLDNEIALTAQNLRLSQMVKSLQEELARVRNTDVLELSNKVLELNKQMSLKDEENQELLRQFGTVKQRESTLKETIRERDEEIENLKDTISELRHKPKGKPAPKSAPKPAAKRSS